ncbi:MAG: hypothetical protein JZU52_15090 [Lamprocystis purpurea]|jgi:hypothetical protein|uniref:hypothetical protein n=1 Tax=Lamprocystis purpurea TaxID=61598 RepID=UPI000379B371|nr:hypothetical protein [Lamprocystis purpurea]MBV5274903.1 hypothetical protein [Lamprocystis purpurea]
MSLSLDDLWLKQLGLWKDANRTRSRRLYRVMVVGAIGVSYLIDTLLLGLFWSTETVDVRVPLFYGCVAAGHVLLFSALHSAVTAARNSSCCCRRRGSKRG